MVLAEYKNLTKSELEWADHCAESGNFSELRNLQEISAKREGKTAKNTDAYINPMRQVLNPSVNPVINDLKSNTIIVKINLVIGNKYNFENQKERLVYLGEHFSGNGYWHQFAKVEKPGIVWCELLTSDLKMIEKLKT